MNRMTKLAMAVAVSTAVMAPAYATNGIMQAGNGMVAHGLGGAGIANAAEAASLADNPALATSIGNQGGVAASLFNPNRSADLSNSPYGFGGWGMTPGSGYVESDSDWFFIPQGSYNATIDQNSSWGIAVYAMGGMNTDYPNTIVGPAGAMVLPEGIGVDLSGLIIAPSYAYKVSPTTSVGAALIIGYAQFEERNLAAAFMAGNPGTTKDTSTGFGIKLGVNSEVSKGVNVGFTYQPELNMSDMKKFCDVGTNALFIDSTSGNCNAVTLPDTIVLGVSAAVGNGKIVADVAKYSWAKVDLFHDFGWKNQTVLKVGYEFGASDMTYRVGFNYGKSPIGPSAAGMNFAFPAITEKHLTVGFSKGLSGGATLTGYYLRALETTVTDDGSEMGGLLKDAKIKMDQNAFGLGVNWKL